jgi:hypothetical protein
VEHLREAIFERPVNRTATREADVAVPLLQAAVSAGVGFVAGLLAGGVGAALFGAPWWVPVVAGPFAGLVMFGWTWYELLDDTRALLREREVYVTDDHPRLDTWGPEEPEEPVESVVHLEVDQRREDGGPRGAWRDLPVNPDHFRTWARAALAGQSLAQTSWTGRSGLFSRSQYDSLLTFLSDAGIVEWVNPASTSQGRRLTRAGRAALEHYTETH